MKPLNELLDALGIVAYREEIRPYYESLTEEELEPISEEEIIRLQEKYGLLGDYLPQVLEGRRLLENDPDRKLWVALATKCIKILPISAVRKLPIPASDASFAQDMAPLFPLLPAVESAVQNYLDHGFSEEEARQFMHTYEGGLSVLDTRIGHPGINTTYFHWIGRYAKASIFRCGGLNFEFTEYPANARVLRNIKTGKIEIIMRNLVFNKNGLPLESAGQNDPDGAFATAMAVTPDTYYGYPVRGIRCVNELTAFPRDEWESLATQGDMMYSVHIPRGADISPEASRSAFRKALEIARVHYPELKIHGLFCHSWLLDPIFDELLPDTSKIRAFGSLYTRYPWKSSGDAVFSFVFPKKVPFEELPENTTLERKLKQLYLAGKCVHVYGGFIPLDF